MAFSSAANILRYMLEFAKGKNKYPKIIFKTTTTTHTMTTGRDKDGCSLRNFPLFAPNTGPDLWLIC